MFRVISSLLSPLLWQDSSTLIFNFAGALHNNEMVILLCYTSGIQDVLLGKKAAVLKNVILILNRDAPLTALQQQ